MHCAQDPPAAPLRMRRARVENKKREREDSTLCEKGEICKEERGHE